MNRVETILELGYELLWVCLHLAHALKPVSYQLKILKRFWLLEFLVILKDTISLRDVIFWILKLLFYHFEELSIISAISDLGPQLPLAATLEQLLLGVFRAIVGAATRVNPLLSLIN